MKNIPIRISVKTVYIPEQSAPESNRFLWSYEIKLWNESDEIVQLLNRFWRITDMTGYVEEVRGHGVVGLQPLLWPKADEFVYTSFCQLTTPQGTMEGHFGLQTLQKEAFILDIPKFILTSPVSISTGLRSRLH